MKKLLTFSLLIITLSVAAQKEEVEPTIELHFTNLSISYNDKSSEPQQVPVIFRFWDELDIAVLYFPESTESEKVLSYSVLTSAMNGVISKVTYPNGEMKFIGEPAMVLKLDRDQHTYIKVYFVNDYTDGTKNIMLEFYNYAANETTEMVLTGNWESGLFTM